MTQTGAMRPQYSSDAYGYAQSSREAYSARQTRSAEDPFSAANGTLHFSSERKASQRTAGAAAAAQATTAQTRTASRSGSGSFSRSSNTGARRTASGGSSQPPKKRRRRKKNKWLTYFAIGFFLFALLALIGAILALSLYTCGGRERCESHEQVESAQPGAIDTPAPATDDTVITANATIEGVPVQNITVQNARAALEQKLEQAKNSVQITVSYDTYSMTLNADNLKLTYADALESALEEAVSGTGSMTLRVPFSFDADALRSALYTLNEQIPNHAVNAKAVLDWKYTTIDGVTYNQPFFDFQDGTNGAQLNYDSVEREVREALDAGNYTASLTPEVTVSEPDITADMIRSQVSKIAEYKTTYRFKGSSSTTPEVAENCMARDRNITKAVSMMQFTELAPGKTFSFNNTTGERSEQKGWSMANAVYLGQGYRKEAGGGVCQVSTTMFNALLRAGVTTFARRGHSIPSDYVTDKFEDGLGFDATVDYGHIDFKFTNDTGNTLYMLVYITKNKESSRRKNINVEIWGQEQPGVEYRVHNEILEETPYNDESKYEYVDDKTMLETEKPVQLNTPHNGYYVKTYVDKYQNGQFVKTIRTEETTYKPIYPIFRRGTAVVTPKPTNTPKPTATPKPDEPEETAAGEP